VRLLTRASRAFFATPSDGFGPLLAARPVVTLAPPGQEAALARMIDEGDGIEPLALDELAAMVPALRPDYARAAAIEREAFDIDVASLHQGFLRVARSNGEVALRARAGRIWHDGPWHAEAADGTIWRAPILINAAGAWGDEVAVIAGVAPIGLSPKRRTAVIVDPGRFDCAGWPLLGDAAHGWYARPEARRKLMLSPADETDMAPHDVQPDEIDVAIAIDRMQQALDIPVTRVEHAWAGLRSFTPDRSLAIGAEPGVPGFFWMVGQGGYGIQTAPAAGRFLAGLVRGEPDADLTAAIAQVDPGRFRRNR